MKILTKAEFLEIPNDTVFMKYSPNQFGELCVKNLTCDDDYQYSALTGEFERDLHKPLIHLLESEEFLSGESIDINVDRVQWETNCDAKQLFAVFEQEDLLKLIRELLRCRGVDLALVMSVNCLHEVWLEGFERDGDTHPPFFCGKFRAECFSEAVEMYVASQGPNARKSYSKENLTYQGRKFFDNLAAAEQRIA